MEWTTAQIRIPAQPLLDIHEVAKLARVSTKTIRRRVAAGEFPPPGRDGRWSGMAIGAWLLWQDYGPKTAPAVPVEPASGGDGDGGDDGGEAVLAARRRGRPADRSGPGGPDRGNPGQARGGP